ncbi:MAG: TrmH family RNA methyltransferase [Planctomycetota bacterium]
MPVPEPRRVTDPTDPGVAVFSQLRDRHVRDRDGRFIAESTAVLKRLLRLWPQHVDRILIDERRWDGLAPDIAAHLERASRRGAPIECMVASSEIIESIAGFDVHRGILAAGRRPSKEEQHRRLCDLRSLTDDSTVPRTLIALDGVADVTNIGTIVRLAAGFRCDGLLLSATCGDPLYRKAIRVSMGQVFSLPWVHLPVPDAVHLVDALHPDHRTATTPAASTGDARYRMIAIETTERARPCWDIHFPSHVCLVFGHEDQGVSPGVLSRCDDVISIPMPAHVTSVNVATSAAIVLYERQRQLMMGAGQGHHA